MASRRAHSPALADVPIRVSREPEAAAVAPDTMRHNRCVRGGIGMAKAAVKGKGTAADPGVVKTPPGTSEYKMYRDETSDPPALVCVVGTTKLSYHLRCIEDLHAMLKKHGDWLLLGSADEQKPAAEGTVEAWARSPKNPVKGWDGLKKGLPGRFGMYVPPLVEALGRA